VLLLAIDTSTRVAGVALADAGGLLAELTWQAGQAHSITLLPNVERLLALSGRTKGDLAAIAVARGPGGYNGLRVGVGTAKTLSFALRLPLVGVSTLEAQAFLFAPSGLAICAFMSAGRSEVAAAVYQRLPDGWVCLREPAVGPPEAILADLPARTLLVGEGTTSFDPALLAERPDVLVAPPLLATRRAGPLAALAADRLAAGSTDPPEALEPLYLRRPQITTPRAGPRRM
jgi:tRNA threonylcarbamoyladenosine biosynthesis protein TsaB